MITINIPYWFFFAFGGVLFITAICSLINDILEWRYKRWLKKFEEDEDESK